MKKITIALFLFAVQLLAQERMTDRASVSLKPLFHFEEVKLLKKKLRFNN
jgi:hypothetical protein